MSGSDRQILQNPIQYGIQPIIKVVAAFIQTTAKGHHLTPSDLRKLTDSLQDLSDRCGMDILKDRLHQNIVIQHRRIRDFTESALFGLILIV